MNSQGLQCLCCRAPVKPGEGKLFAAVFVCPSCYTIAERIFTKAESDLRHLLTVMKDVIRVGLLEGRLQFQNQPQGEVPKAALLKELIDLAESTSVWGPQIQQSPHVVAVVDEEKSIPNTPGV